MEGDSEQQRYQRAHALGMLGSGSGGSLLALVLLSFCNEPVELEVDDDQLTPLRRQYRSTLTAT